MTKLKSTPHLSRASGEHAGTDGFTLSFVDGRGVLGLKDVALSDTLTLDRLDLVIPRLAFPFDISSGVRGLRHRRHLLSRLQVTARAVGLEQLIQHRLAASDMVRLRAISLERHHLAFLVRFGPRGEDVPLSFRLTPTLADDTLVFALDAVRAYGPLTVNLLSAAATSLHDMLDVTVDGLEVVPPNVVRQVLMSLLPVRGWRLPDYDHVRLAKLTLLPDRVEIDFRHPEIHPGMDPIPFETDEGDLERLLRQEENHISGNADRLLTRERTADARGAYSKLLDRDADNPFIIARIAMLDILNPHLRESARSLATAAAEQHPHRGDLASVLLQAAALEGDGAQEEAILSRLSEGGNTLENLAVNMRRGELILDRAPERAAEFFERALSARRDDRDALFSLIRARAYAKQRDRVLGLIPRWLATAADGDARSIAHTDVGDLLLRELADPKEAVGHFERALVANPDNHRATWGLAESLAAMDEVERAVNHFERLARLHRAAGDLSLAADAVSRLGDIWLDKGVTSLAVQRYIGALELVPDHTERRLKLARLLSRLSKPAQAAKAFETALNQSEAQSAEDWWGEAALDLAMLYLDALGDAASAKTWARAAMAADVSRQRARGLLRGLLGKAESVESLMSNLSSPAEVLNLATELKDAAYEEKARDVLEQGMFRFPENVELADRLIAESRDARDLKRLKKTLAERIETVVSPKRRGEMEVELGLLTLRVEENPSAAIFWFRSALKKDAYPEAERGLDEAFDLLEQQADQLIDAKEYEAARMLFAVLETDQETRKRHEENLEKAEAAMRDGAFEDAYQTAMNAARGSSDARTQASLLAGRALFEQGRRREAVQSLERMSKSVDEANAVSLVLAAIDISAKDIADHERARFVLEQHLTKHPGDEDVDQGIVRLLAITGQRTKLAEYLMRRRNAATYTARLKRAAELFMADGEYERAADTFEALYRETDAIDDLFLLANALRQAGHYETLIGLLEERRNEDSRIQSMLRNDLAAYAAMLKQHRAAPSSSHSRDARVATTSHPASSLFPEDSLPPVEDDGFDLKLSSAFTQLRKDKKDPKD